MVQGLRPPPPTPSNAGTEHLDDESRNGVVGWRR